MLVRIHSMVDVITNSSTTVYTWADEDADKRAKEILADLMKVFGVKGEVDDFFDVKLVKGTRWLDNHEGYGDNSGKYILYSDDVDGEEELAAVESVGGVKGDKERYVLTKDQAMKLLETGLFGNSSDGYDDRGLVVTAKTADIGDVAARFSSLFSTNSSYD